MNFFQLMWFFQIFAPQLAYHITRLSNLISLDCTACKHICERKSTFSMNNYILFFNCIIYSFIAILVYIWSSNCVSIMLQQMCAHSFKLTYTPLIAKKLQCSKVHKTELILYDIFNEIHKRHCFCHCKPYPDWPYE